jgi:hypothetical protein
MTKQAGFKRLVRARMAKTGGSYATARSRLLAGHPGTTPDDSLLDWMPGALHISNGDATEWPGTGLARRVVYWRDILHEGPASGTDVHRLRTVCPSAEPRRTPSRRPGAMDDLPDDATPDR